MTGSGLLYHHFNSLPQKYTNYDNRSVHVDSVTFDIFIAADTPYNIIVILL